MNITIEATGFTASEHLKGFIQEKVEHLFRQNDKILRVEVHLLKDAEGHQEKQWCELNIAIPGDNVFVKKKSELFEKSIATAVKAVQKIMRRSKVAVIHKRKTRTTI
ncbi:MAG: HPF/RaiA family ribosome-associated protein [Chitinophagales bacterium]|jgi:putative sigma-54 modulation protein|nr:HPF/RaiA family ribosome-associated protein [Chitinophagales bacterium]